MQHHLQKPAKCARTTGSRTSRLRHKLMCSTQFSPSVARAMNLMCPGLQANWDPISLCPFHHLNCLCNHLLPAMPDVFVPEELGAARICAGIVSSDAELPCNLAQDLLDFTPQSAAALYPLIPCTLTHSWGSPLPGPQQHTLRTSYTLRLWPRLCAHGRRMDPSSIIPCMILPTTQGRCTSMWPALAGAPHTCVSYGAGGRWW